MDQATVDLDFFSDPQRKTLDSPAGVSRAHTRGLGPNFKNPPNVGLSTKTKNHGVSGQT
jgi:hypothetical protein